MSKRNRHMVKDFSSKPELAWITLEFGKGTPKSELSGTLKIIQQMGMQCKFRTAPDGNSFIEVLCNDRQVPVIDRLVRSQFKVLGSPKEHDIDTTQELLDNAFQEKGFHLPEDKGDLSISSAAMGAKNAFEDFPQLKRPNMLLEKASEICKDMLEVDPRRTEDAKTYRGVFIPSYVTGYRVGAQQAIHMNARDRRSIISDISASNQRGQGSLILAKFEMIIKSRMQEVGATKVSELFED